ncbi:MAG: MlaD family protein [Bacteroides sp.]|nr:MlaD family protein [Bacteroides sp.]
MKYFTKEVKIGLTGILALCLLVYGINWLKGIHLFKPSTYYYVHFSNINGLTKSSPVFSDGFRVGIVRDMHYDYTKPGNITVEIELDTEIKIPKGSQAQLEAEILGGVRMNLLLERSNTYDFYQVGDTLPGNLSFGIMETVATLMPQLDSMLPKLDSILGSLNQILTDPAIPATFRSMETTTANLAATSNQLRILMNRDIPELTGKLNRIGDNFIAVSDQLKDLDYQSTFEQVEQTLTNVKLLTDKLNRKDNTIGLLLNDPDFYNNLNATTANAASLLEDLQTNPKRYVHFSLFGRK